MHASNIHKRLRGEFEPGTSVMENRELKAKDHGMQIVGCLIYHIVHEVSLNGDDSLENQTIVSLQ